LNGDGRHVRCKLEHEIFRETIHIPFDPTIQSPSFYPIKFSQMTIEHYFLATNQENEILNP
jgi:hypothetical protein